MDVLVHFSQHRSIDTHIDSIENQKGWKEASPDFINNMELLLHLVVKMRTATRVNKGQIRKDSRHPLLT